jgi:hypothetical protein
MSRCPALGLSSSRETSRPVTGSRLRIWRAIFPISLVRWLPDGISRRIASYRSA